MIGCYDKELDARLATIEGHIKAIRKMVEEQKDCPEILMQMSAVESAIKSASTKLLTNHIHHCVKNSVECGDLSALDKLEKVIKSYR